MQFYIYFLLSLVMVGTLKIVAVACRQADPSSLLAGTLVSIACSLAVAGNITLSLSTHH
jgi:hypothetical protein